MTNNDFLRSFRYALELTPSELVELFAYGDVEIPLARVAAMLKEEDEPGYEPLSDALCGQFLDGVVAAHRGRRDPAPEPRPAAPARITNNRVLRALRIAFELRDVDVLECMQAAGREVSKTELNALFRREDHRNYQPCGDQFLRSFLRGLSIWRRQGRPDG